VWSTVLFLGLPYLIFSIAWVRWYLAIPFTGVLLLSFWKALSSEMQGGQTAPLLLRWQPIIAISALILGWNYFSGVGYFSYQNADWEKHNAILLDLIHKDWPVTYTIIRGGTHSYNLVYYLAYYLPIAVIGKIVQAKFAVTYFAYTWNVIATALAVAWLFRFTGGVSVLVVCGFIFFSGLDIVPFYMKHLSPSSAQHIEAWTGVGMLQFSSNSTTLYWVPQHGFGAWLGTSLVLHQYLKKNDSRNTLFYWALSLFWSPFIFIGQFLFVALDLIYKKCTKLISFQNIVGGGITIVILGLFYSSRSVSNKIEFFTLQQLADNWYLFLVFITLEFLVYLPFIAWIFRTGVEKRYRYLCVPLIGNVIGAMIFHLGAYNDFCMRVSLPGLFILQILLFKNFVPFGGTQWRRVANVLLIAVLIVGAQTSIREIYRGVAGPKSTINLSNTLMNDLDFSFLYLGSIDSVYSKQIAAP